MNKTILKERISAEMERARESLTSAKVLLRDGLFADSISRAYYAIFHAARAVLLTKNIDPTTHNGAIAMFGLHFIKPGIIEDNFGKIYNETKDVRELGDYIVTKKFTKEEAKKRTKQAVGFLNRMSKYLEIYSLK